MPKPTPAPLAPPADATTPVVLLSRLLAKDDDAARDLAIELAKLESSEPGSLSDAVMTVENEPLVFVIIESWSTRTEAEAHEARGQRRRRRASRAAAGRRDPDRPPLPAPHRTPPRPRRHHMRTTGNTILITGAGTGMGLEAARRFSKLGNTVLMVARNRERLEPRPPTWSTQTPSRATSPTSSRSISCSRTSTSTTRSSTSPSSTQASPMATSCSAGRTPSLTRRRR